jgi:putative peptidoglycan lipid II flippase
MRKSFFSLFFGGLFGKALGFLRELLLARFFGTSMIIDSYRASFIGIFIPINFFTTDALNAGFIPLYRRYHADDNENRHVLFWGLSFGLAIFSLLFTAGIYFGANFWTALLVPGFSHEAKVLTATFLKVMAIGVPFYLQSAISSYLEMGNGVYWQYSMRASVQSVALIGGTCAAFYLRQPMYLAWSFTVCYVLLCIVGWLYMWHKQFLVWPRQWRMADVWHIQADFWTRLAPLLPLPLFLQGNIAIERVVSSFLGTGVVASFEYAKLIIDTGVLLLGAPLGMAGLSHLSGLDHAEVRDRIQRMLPFLFVVLIASSAILFIDSDGIVRILFKRGAFNAQSVHLTSVILAGLAVGFWAQVISYVLIKAMNAQLRNREVLFYSVAGLLLNCLVNILTFKWWGPACLGISYSMNGILLLALTIHAFDLWSAIWKDLCRLSAGVAVYLCLVQLLRSAIKLSDLVDLAIAAIYWLAYVVALKPYRDPVEKFILQLLARKRVALG